MGINNIGVGPLYNASLKSTFNLCFPGLSGTNGGEFLFLPRNSFELVYKN